MLRIIINLSIIVLLSCFLTSCSTATVSLTRNQMSFLNDNTKLTWFGIDFSNVKLIDKYGFTNPPQIRDEYFNSINNVVINESKKYDLGSSFGTQEIEIDLKIVKKKNLETKIDGLVIDISEKGLLITENDIASIINDYEIENKQGLGVVFIMQSIIKTSDYKIGNMFVTFFDINNKNILLTKKMSGKPGGFGFRNYWVRTVKNVLDQIKY